MKSILMLVVIAIFLSVSTQSQAEDVPVMRVIVVESDDPVAYVKEVLETGRAHVKRLQGNANLRVWRAKFAGQDAGSIVVAIEYPSLEALAEGDKRAAADPALRAWVKSLSKMRKIVSDSLYSEAKM